MTTVRTYRDLEAWQSGMSLVERCYAITRSFPGDERFVLTAQIRRSAISIPSNVAEGACRQSTGAFTNHVSIALGSHAEVETCLDIAFRLGYLSAENKAKVLEISDTTGRLLNGLLRSLQSRSPRR